MIQHVKNNQCNTHINRMRGKKHMIIQTDAGKNIWQNDEILSWFKKKKSEQGIGRNYLNIIKVICEKNHSEHYIQWWKTESFSPKIRNKAIMFTLITSIQHSTGSPTYINQTKRNKMYPNWKGRG